MRIARQSLENLVVNRPEWFFIEPLSARFPPMEPFRQTSAGRILDPHIDGAECNRRRAVYFDPTSKRNSL